MLLQRTALLLAFCLLSLSTALAQESQWTPAAKAAFEKGEELRRQSKYGEAAAEHRKAIELDPSYAEAHTYYILTSKLSVRDPQGDSAKSKAASDAMVETLKKQYAAWIEQDPKRAAYHWGLGDLHIHKDYDKLEQHMRKAVEIDPKFARAWQALALVEEVRGNNAQEKAYLKKAAGAAPDNPAYAFYYANSLKTSDKVLYAKAALEVAQRFPAHERGAQSLYWLGFNETNPAKKLAYLEQLRSQYSVAKFSWSSSGMYMLFEEYHKTTPDKALALAEEMTKAYPRGSQNRDWQARLDYQKSMLQARALLDKKDFAAAAKLLDETKLPARFDGTKLFQFKVEAASEAATQTKVYTELLKQTVKEPSDDLQKLLVVLGGKLAKSQSQVEADLFKEIDAQAKPAKEFSLKRYGDDKVISLADYRGKVVLLNFWYPFCGPCRGENPSLQKVLRKVGLDKFAILAVNVYPTEDQFVMPYMKGNRFDFVPLRGNEEFSEKEWGARGYPTNFLIDPQGNTIHRLGPMRGEDEERRFELQIRMLLERHARTANKKSE
jgi:thiol-disulfide isomerase/thioredoxin/Tfp pilus assembly protein PilF